LDKQVRANEALSKELQGLTARTERVTSLVERQLSAEAIASRV